MTFEPWTYVLLYFAIGMLVKITFFRGVKWIFNDKNVARFMIISFWPLFMLLMLISTAAGFCKLIYTRISRKDDK